MKRDQVPQDDADLMDGHREVVYAVDENGKYVKALSPGWDPKNTALLQAWEQIDEKVRETCRLVEDGKASPLAVFMARNIFDIKLLSDYTGIPRKKIKSHLEPDAFKRLDEETLGKYAEAFNITLAELVNWRPDMETVSQLHDCRTCHSEPFADVTLSETKGLSKRDSSAPPQNNIIATDSDGEATQKDTEENK